MFEGDFYGINAETVTCCETKVQVDRVRVRIRWNTCFIIYKLGLRLLFLPWHLFITVIWYNNICGYLYL